MNARSIDASEFATLFAQPKTLDLIDVRTPAEFREAHVPNARNVPLNEIDAAAMCQVRRGSAEPLYVICQSGGRGRQACELLLAAGCENVANVAGGTAACKAAGVPLTYGRPTMSLERQVRVAAGGLVVLGAALSFVHPMFLGLSIFVGAGLLFSGLTDTCGMATLLARMPWNRAAA